VIDERVVACELLDLPGSHTVAARVTDVTDVHALLLGTEHGPHDRGPHPVVLARPRGPFEDLPVGDTDAGEQAVFLLAQVGVEMEGPGDVLVCSRPEELGNRFRRDLRRHVAGAVAAHSVGHDE